MPCGGIGTNTGRAKCQVVNGSCRDDWHEYNACVVAYAAFFQVEHYSARRIESKGAAACKHDGVDTFNEGHGAQQVGFACGGRTASYIDASHSGCVAEDDGAARARLKVGVVSNANAGDIGDVVVHDYFCSLS